MELTYKIYIIFRCPVHEDDTENLGPGRDRLNIEKNAVVSKQKIVPESQWQGKICAVKFTHVLFTRWNRVENANRKQIERFREREIPISWAVNKLRTPKTVAHVRQSMGTKICA